MKKESKPIPDWLQWPSEIEHPSEPNLLAESRKEMYEALSLFHTHVRSVIYIMVSAFTLIVVIMRLWPNAQPEPILYLMSGIILTFILPIIGFFSIRVIRRYYEVYIAALIFASRIHISIGYQQVHPWLERTIKQAQGLPDVDNSLEFMKIRTKSKEDTFTSYKRIINIISIASLICGIVLLSFAVIGFLKSGVI